MKITWIPNYSCPIWTFCNCGIPVIGHPRDFHVNYTRFKGFLRNVWISFQNLPKALLTISPKRNSQKTFLILKFVIDTFSNSDWTSCHRIQGVIVLIISNRSCASRLSDFEITRVITPSIVLHSVQLLSLIAVNFKILLQYFTTYNIKYTAIINSATLFKIYHLQSIIVLDALNNFKTVSTFTGLTLIY